MSLQPPPPPAPSLTTTGATLGRRAMARAIDTLLVFIVVGIVGAVLVWPELESVVEQAGDDPSAIQAGIEQAMASGDLVGTDIEITILLIGISLILYILFEPLYGGSPGKLMLGLRVVETGEDRPSARVAAVRNAWLVLWAVPVLGSWLVLGACIALGVTIANSADNRGVHDRWAHATVVRR